MPAMMSWVQPSRGRERAGVTKVRCDWHLRLVDRNLARMVTSTLRIPADREYSRPRPEKAALPVDVQIVFSPFERGEDMDIV